MKIVIYHSADYDGIFCREIARKFLGDKDVQYLGWNFGDDPIAIPPDGTIYVMDLPIDRVFGITFGKEGHFRWLERTIWIDHHKTAIETHNPTIPGYRIDGVAACRLAWQWFTHTPYWCVGTLKEAYVERNVIEPFAVRLAGEYDIWDKRDPNAELFQHGLRSEGKLIEWARLWDTDENPNENTYVYKLLEQGQLVRTVRDEEYAEVIQSQGFTVEFEGRCYLACNSHELDIRSQLFEAGIKPEHEGLLGFTWTGKAWRVSLYGIPGKDIDHSAIAKKHGGGGHKQACGFTCKTLPFNL